uniref:CUE domain-containing protein n=1 Tax=Tetradesmus obliquus TaxID=3088 RepID=A0A383V5A5_TETOB
MQPGASQQLQELFPLHSKLQIDAALAKSSGSLEEAAEVLLQQQPAAPAAPAAPGHSSYCSPKARSAVTPPPAGQTWAALRRHANGQQLLHSSNRSAPCSPAEAHHRSPPAPVFVRQRGQAPPAPKMTADAFPSLAGTSSSAVPLADGGVGTSQQQQQQQHVLPPKAGGVRRSSSAPSFAEAAKQQQQQQHHQLQREHHRLQQQQQQRQQHQQQPQQQQPQTQQDIQQLVHQLADLHPWCEPELLQEVLSSVDNNAAAAAAALSDLAPAGVDCNLASSVHGSSKDSSAAAGAIQGNCSSSVLAMAGDVEGSSQAGYSRQLPPPLQPQPQQQQQQQQQELGSGDIYHSVRRDALRLTRQWQKTLRRASAAASAGDRSAAQQLHSEAATLKAAADAAHAAAALKIEVLHNMDSAAGLVSTYSCA